MQQNAVEAQNNIQLQTVPKLASIFDYALSYFQIRIGIILISRLYIVISQSIILYNLQQYLCEYNDIYYWVLISDIQAIVSLFLYGSLIILASNKRIVEHLAFQYDYLIEVPIDQATNDRVAPTNLDPTAHLINNKKFVDPILYQIRKDLPKSKLICNIFNWINHIFTQLIFIWTFYYLFSVSSFYQMFYYHTDCERWPHIQIFFIGLFLFIQYYKYYLIATIILILLPFILIIFLIKYFSNKKKKQETLQVLRILQQNKILYKPNVLQGDQECSICMQPYSIDDEILELPCSVYHHFHNNCISVWFQIQSSCPNCRKDLVSDNNEAPFLVQQNI